MHMVRVMTVPRSKPVSVITNISGVCSVSTLAGGLATLRKHPHDVLLRYS